MWKYVKRYLHFAVPAALFMVGEVLMDLVQPEIMSRIVDEGVLGAGSGGVGDLAVIQSLGLKMIGLVLVGGLCGSLNNMMAHLASQNIGNEMRKDCFRNIMEFSFPQVEKLGAGSLVTRVTNDITQVQNFVALFIRGMIRTSMLTFGSMYFMFRINRQFGLLVLCAFPFLTGCMAVCLWKSNPMFSRLQTQLDQINTILQEDVSGIRIIKACVRELREKARFGKANEKLTDIQLRVLLLFAFMNPAVNALMYAVVVLILLAGSFQVGQGITTPGVIMAAITYTTQLLNGIMMLVMLFQNISRGYASWKRIREILQMEPQLRDGGLCRCASETSEDPGKSEDAGAPGREECSRKKRGGRIEFRDVSFSYPGSSQVILDHISLTVNPGETVAVMGTTGCGKTTLVSLIPRFYDVTGGAVLVDGVDVREYGQKALREKIAFALQKSELFSRTVSENIGWGKPGAEKQEIVKAAKTAQADEFISRMPDGYETLVAERGMSLSGGQKQRIAVARAVVKDAEILILDDSTSALDLKTEASLYEALRETAPGLTRIIVAQRIASVRQADRIVVMEGGRIAGCGTHDELMEQCSAYRDIYDSQLGEEEEHG